ncbi:MAG: CBS domain-containing protein [Clostridia bacterium]|nr:CBS domain-containing protein [Clostridia bacterium]
MKVKECMCNEVFSCSPSTTVYDAAKIMQTKHVGCIPVCDNQNCMIGVITDRDLVLRCIANDKNAKDTPISDIMTTNVWTCKPDDEMTNAQSKMGNEQIRRLPVVDNNGKVVGMLTLGDLAKNDMELGQDEVSDTINSICECNEENKNAE